MLTTIAMLWLFNYEEMLFAQDIPQQKILRNIYSVNLNTTVIPHDYDVSNSAYAHMHQASIYEQKGQLFKAVNEYNRALELEPREIMAHYNLGIVYYNIWKTLAENKTTQIEAMEYLNKAEEEFLWVREANPNIVMTCFKLGRIASIKGNTSETIYYYKEGIRLSPDNFIFYFNLASIYEEAGDLDLAIAYYKMCIKIEKTFPHAYNNLALLYEQLGYEKEAEEYYKQALKADKGHSYSQINLGSLYTRMEKYKQALKHLKKAQVLEPQNPWVYLHLGFLYEKQEQYELAYASYVKFVELKPGYSKGYYILCKLLDKMNKQSEAMLAGIVYLKLDPAGEYSLDVKYIIKKIQLDILKEARVPKEGK
jgi:protein O-GlcNAc transferase